MDNTMNLYVAGIPNSTSETKIIPKLNRKIETLNDIERINYEILTDNYDKHMKVVCEKYNDWMNNHDQNKYVKYTIQDAVIDNNLYMLIFFCRNGCDVNQKYSHLTLLYIAAMLRRYNGARILLEFGADPNMGVIRHDVLNYVCQLGDFKMLRILLSHPNIDINSIDSTVFNSGFEHVVRQYNIPCINEFINRFGDEYISTYNAAELMQCCKNPKIVKDDGLLGELIKGSESLFNVIKNKNAEILIKLILSGVNINNKHHERSLISTVYERQWYDGIDILLKLGSHTLINPHSGNLDNYIQMELSQLRYSIEEYGFINTCEAPECKCMSCKDNFHNVEKMIFAEYTFDKIKLYKKDWRPNMQYLYPLSTQSILNWLMLKKRIDDFICYIPNEISFTIISNIIRKSYPVL
jgi:hypothetical protein